MADVASSLKNWSSTAASNSPTSATTIGTGLAPNFQQIQATLRNELATRSAAVTAAVTTDIGVKDEGTVLVTNVAGTIAITSFGTVSAGIKKLVTFTVSGGSLSITYNATSMILPSAASVTVVTGDSLYAESLGSGNWKVHAYYKQDGSAPSAFTDTSPIVKGSADATKLLRIEVDGLTTATTRTVTAQDADITMAGIQNISKVISGMVISNNAIDVVNDIDISAGACIDGTGATPIILSALTKQLDAAWAVGTNAGGLDTGAIGNSDYYVWAIKRPDTGVTDALFSLSSTAPTMPANYTFKRLIGFIKRVAGAIVLFHAYETEGGGLEIIWYSPTLDIDLAATLTTSRRTDAVKVPLTFSVKALLNVVVDDASGSMAWVYCPDQADLAPSLTVTPLRNIGFSTANVTNGMAQIIVRTSATGTIAARASVATIDNYRVSTVGFTWARRN
jgi:hypothetical protein